MSSNNAYVSGSAIILTKRVRSSPAQELFGRQTVGFGCDVDPLLCWITTDASITAIMTEKMNPEAVPMTLENADPQNPEQVPEWLGSRLRQMYTEVMAEPVPDEFVALLKKLEDKERS